MTVWLREHLERWGHWRDWLNQYRPDFVSVKLINGVEESNPHEQGTLVEDLRRLDLEVHGWGFHYLTGVRKARAEARRVAGVCTAHRISDYHVNAEKYWAHSKNPEAHMVAFVEEMRLLVPFVKLWANTFSGPMTKFLVNKFDVWEPMCYAASRRWQSWQFKRRLDKFDGTEQLARSAMINTGRLSGGKVQGWWRDKGRMKGWRSLIERHQPEYINYYRAPLGWHGHEKNPSVGQQIRELRGEGDIT